MVHLKVVAFLSGFFILGCNFYGENLDLMKKGGGLSSVSIMSLGGLTGYAKEGDQVEVSIGTSKPIKPSLQASIANRTATIAQVDALHWTATVTMTAADAEGEIPFSLTGIEDLAGKRYPDVSRTTDTTVVIYDRTAPVCVSITSTSPEGTYVLDEVIDIALLMSEDVFLYNDQAIVLNLNTGRTVQLSPVDTNPRLFTGTYTVQSGDLTAALSVTAFSVDPIRDLAGNSRAGTLPAINIETGKTIIINADGQPQALLENTPAQLTTATTATITVTGTEIGTYSYRLDSGTWNYDIPVATPISLTGLSDQLHRLEVLGKDSYGEEQNAATPTVYEWTVDATAPRISSISSTTANGIYGTGATINVTLTFSEPVTLVDGPLVIRLETGTTDREVSMALISGASSAQGTYTVQDGDESPDLTANLVFLAVGTLRDQAGNDANLDLPAGYNIADQKAIEVHTLYPYITEAKTLDVDANGRIDGYRLTFSKNVDDSTFPGYVLNAKGSAQTDWLVAGYTNVRLAHGSAAPESDTIDDNVLYLVFDEYSDYDTDLKPDLTTTTTPQLTGLEANPAVIATTTGVVETDGASPVIVAAVGTAGESTLTIDLSEPVDADGGTCSASFASPPVTWTDVNSAGATAVSGISDGNGCDQTLAVTLNAVLEDGVTGDFSGDTIQAIATTIYDAANNASKLTVQRLMRTHLKNWTALVAADARKWRAIASSIDCRVLAAAGDETALYTSTDAGVSWNEESGPGVRSWSALASSYDGSRLAAVPSSGNIFLGVKAPTGYTWTAQAGPGSHSWGGIASSADGRSVAAIVTGTTGGYIYTTADSGTTWSERQGCGQRNWQGIVSSADGQKLAATAWEGYIYTSTNGGVNWTERTTSGVRKWKGITSSADGVYLAATDYSSYIFTSSNSGVSWTMQTASASRSWQKIISSLDGYDLAALSGSPDAVYFSADYGANWGRDVMSIGMSWTGIAGSSGLLTLVVPTFDGYLYHMDDGPSWVLESANDWITYYAGAIAKVTAKGSSGAATASYIGSTYTGDYKWFGGALAPNGKIYCAPVYSTSILVIDTNTDSTYLVGNFPGTDKWSCAVLSPQGKIYFFPMSQTNVLVLNPADDSFYTFDSGYKYFAGGVLATNGKIYCVPTQSRYILVIDPADNSTELVDTQDTSLNNWRGAVLAPNGKIYFMKSSATYILVVDPLNNNALTTITPTPPTSDTFSGGALAANGKIYGFPYSASNVLCIDSVHDTATTIPIGGAIIGDGGVFGPDGKVYGTPRDGNMVIVNPTDNTATYQHFTTGTDPWASAVLAPNGKMYCIPYNGTQVLKVDFHARGTFDANIVLSPYFNKF